MDDSLYLYSGAHEIRLFFNCVYKLVGATFYGQNYIPFEKLNAYQMVGIFILDLFYDFSLSGSSGMLLFQWHEISHFSNCYFAYDYPNVKRLRI